MYKRNRNSSLHPVAMSLVGCLQGFTGPLAGTAAVSAVSYGAGAAIRGACTEDTTSGSGSGDLARVLNLDISEHDWPASEDLNRDWWTEVLMEEMEIVEDEKQVQSGTE